MRVTAQRPRKRQLSVAWSGGLLNALLGARLIARLWAARPDNLAIQLLYTLTTPLIKPFQRLDAHQPRFGAVLELSTLALLSSLLLISYLTWWFLQPKQQISDA